MLASLQSTCLQVDMEEMTGLFEGVEFLTSFNKMLRMVYQPFRMASGQSESVYQRWVTGVGPYFQEMNRKRVRCPECTAELAEELLVAHH